MDYIPVQQETAEAFVKVAEQALDGLFQDLHGSGSLYALGSLLFQIIVQDLGNRVRMRHGDQLLALGDILPVVDKQGFEMIGHLELH